MGCIDQTSRHPWAFRCKIPWPLSKISGTPRRIEAKLSVTVGAGNGVGVALFQIVLGYNR